VLQVRGQRRDAVRLAVVLREELVDELLHGQLAAERLLDLLVV
jgi:hypothetical protein